VNNDHKIDVESLMNDTLIEVDTRQEIKTPAKPVVEAEPMSEMGRFFGEHPPEQKMRGRAVEERDAVCNIVRWKLQGALRSTWRDDLELTYQAKLAKCREYWLAFMKPDRLYSAEEVSSLMKSLWIAENSAWTQELLLLAVEALGI
jgi:hypothetical protein